MWLSLPLPSLLTTHTCNIHCCHQTVTWAHFWLQALYTHAHIVNIIERGPSCVMLSHLTWLIEQQCIPPSFLLSVALSSPAVHGLPPLALPPILCSHVIFLHFQFFLAFFVLSWSHEQFFLQVNSYTTSQEFSPHPFVQHALTTSVFTCARARRDTHLSCLCWVADAPPSSSSHIL